MLSRNQKGCIATGIVILPFITLILAVDTYKSIGINNFKAECLGAGALLCFVLTIVQYKALFTYIRCYFKLKKKGEIWEDIQAIGVTIAALSFLMEVFLIFLRLLVRTGDPCIPFLYKCMLICFITIAFGVFIAFIVRKKAAYTE